MNILLINTVDAKGGAAVSAYRLHKELIRQGHSSRMLVGEKLSDDPSVSEIGGMKGRLRHYKDSLEGITGLQYFFSTGPGAILNNSAFRDSDVVHLHNTHGGYLNLWAVREIARHKPLVWTLHDMWPITGHCCHSLDCERWKEGCGQCPYPETYPAVSIDTTKMLLAIKKKIYSEARFLITAPSRWLLDKLQESIISDKKAFIVANAVDADEFRPREKAVARQGLGLPRDRFIVMFASSGGIKNPYKGFDYAAEAVRILYSKGLRPFLLVAGNVEKTDLKGLGIEGADIGEVKDIGRMADCYSSSDALILPSIAENSPLTALEALATGVPVVAFDTGGVKEAVLHKRTGYIARQRDAYSLSEGVRWVMELSHAGRERLSMDCAGLIRERHTLRSQAGSFLEVYREATLLRQGY
jgi:glycosyltransferase involved in cell wall biosynthesis